jgi:hypothetical protein
MHPAAILGARSLTSVKRVYLAQIGAMCLRASESENADLIEATIDVLRPAPAQLARLEELAMKRSSETRIGRSPGSVFDEVFADSEAAM